MYEKDMQLTRYLTYSICLLTFILARVCYCQTKTLCKDIFGECFEVPEFQRNTSSSCKCYLDGFAEPVCADDALNDVRLLPENVTRAFRSFPREEDINSPTTSFLGQYLRYVLINADCRYIPVSYGPSNFTLIDSCPRETTPPPLKDLCDDKSSYPPVTYRGPIDVTFQNIHCQQCQFHSMETTFILWEPEIQCNDTLPKTWREIERRLNIGSCGYLYNRPTPHPICDYLITEHLKSVLKSECQICIQEQNISNSYNITLDCLVCEIVIVAAEAECMPSQSGQGLVNLFKLPTEKEVKLRLNGGLFKSSQLCEDDENFDLMFQRCRKFQCPAERVARKGECVDREMTFVEAATQLFPKGAQFLLVDLNYAIDEESQVSDFFSPLQPIVEGWKETLSFGRIIDLSFHRVGNEQNTYSIAISGLEGVQIVNVIEILSLSYSFVPETATLEIQFSNMLDDLMARNESAPFISLNQTKEHGICTSGQLSCVSDAKVFFLKEDLFAKVDLGSTIKIFPVDNILFNLTISAGSEENIYFNEVCMCLSEVSLESEVSDSNRTLSGPLTELNCSFPIYQYDSSEFRILDSGDMELLDQPVTFSASRVYIQNNTSALVCYDPNKKVIFFNLDYVQTYLSWICTGLSVFFLLITLLSHVIFKQLRNLPGKITMALSVFLIAGQILLMLPDFSPSVCRYVAAFTHFSWLSVFLWMSCQACNMFITFHPRFMKSSTSSTSAFWKYAMFSLVLPGSVTVVLLVMDAVHGEHFHVKYGLVSCVWMADQYGYYFAFFLPVALTLAFNLVCFTLTLYNIERSIATCEGVTGRKRDRNRCVIYIKLSSVMGFSWIFGLIASGAGVHALWYVYIILNGLQGVFIFLSFTINARTRKLFTTTLSRSKFTSLFKTDSTRTSSHKTASTTVSSPHGN